MNECSMIHTATDKDGNKYTFTIFEDMRMKACLPDGTEYKGYMMKMPTGGFLFAWFGEVLECPNFNKDIDKMESIKLFDDDFITKAFEKFEGADVAAKEA